MGEGRRFLRYATPGLVLIVELGLLLWIFDPVGWLSTIGSALGGSPESAIGIAITALVASGGIGAVFSAVHHTLLWTVYPQSWFLWSGLACDLRHIVEVARAKSLFTFVVQTERAHDRDFRQLEPCERFTMDGAWRVMRANSDARKETSLVWRGAYAGVRRLFDIMHSAGTTLVAAVFGFALWVGLCPFHGLFFADTPSRRAMETLGLRFFCALFVGWAFLRLCLANYRLTLRQCCGVFEMVFLHDCLRRSDENDLKHIVVCAENDIEKKGAQSRSRMRRSQLLLRSWWRECCERVASCVRKCPKPVAWLARLVRTCLSLTAWFVKFVLGF